jgi:hypothetical protein
MNTMFLFFAHILATITKLFRLGGVEGFVSERLLLKKQVLFLSRSRFYLATASKTRAIAIKI